MAHRTTILLDDESRRAARELALRLDCSVSEAIRQAIVRYRDMTAGVTAEESQRRREALDKLFVLFEGHDADVEIARLKSEDEFF